MYENNIRELSEKSVRIPDMGKSPMAWLGESFVEPLAIFQFIFQSVFFIVIPQRTGTIR